MDERPRPGIATAGATPEERVDGADEGGRAAVVAAEREALPGVPACAEVREHVGPAKGVDRLLRVADEHERRALERPPKDSLLPRVGVLELVDERDPVLPAHGPAQDGPDARVVQRVVDPLQEIRKGQHARACAQAPPRRLRRRDEVGEQRQSQLPHGRLDVRARPERGVGADLGRGLLACSRRLVDAGRERLARRGEHGVDVCVAALGGKRAHAREQRGRVRRGVFGFGRRGEEGAGGALVPHVRKAPCGVGVARDGDAERLGLGQQARARVARRGGKTLGDSSERPRHAAGDGDRGERRVRPHAREPRLVEGAAAPLGVAVVDRERERLAALERRPLQDALAEAVDGEHGRLARGEGGAQARPRPRAVGRRLAPVVEKGPNRLGRLASAFLERDDGLPERPPDAGHEFSRRGARERHDECAPQVRRSRVVVEHARGRVDGEARDEGRQGRRLARPGRRLDERHAGREENAVRVESGHGWQV